MRVVVVSIVCPVYLVNKTQSPSWGKSGHENQNEDKRRKQRTDKITDHCYSQANMELRKLARRPIKKGYHMVPKILVHKVLFDIMYSANL